MRTFREFIDDKAGMETGKMPPAPSTKASGAAAVKVGGKYINPSDITSIGDELMDVEIMKRLPIRTFSNVLEWRWASGKTIRVHLYEEYGFVEKRVDAPEGWEYDHIWVLKRVIPLGSFKDQEIDEIPIIKKAVQAAAKNEDIDWTKKVRFNALFKKLKKEVKELLPKMWFAVEKMESKKLGPKRGVIYVPCVGGGAGHTEQQRLYQFMIEMWVDEHNIIHIVQGNIEGSYHGGDWKIGPSDLVSHFGAWQDEDEIVDAVAEFAGRY